MPILRTWAGLEDSPEAVLKTECLERGYQGPQMEEFAETVDEALLGFVGQPVDIDGLRNVIHGCQQDANLGMTNQDEYELARELLAAFGV